MKKLERLRLCNLSNVVTVLQRDEAYGYKGGTTTDQYGNTVYSDSEFKTLTADGDWQGGYVDGYGYVGKQITIFSGSGTYHSDAAAWAGSQHNDFWDHILGTIVGSLPTAPLTDAAGAMLDNAKWAMASDLMQNGRTNEPLFYSYDNSVGKNGAIKVYNASSGELIGTYKLGF